jgi:tRNA(Ile)-lysidine synthase TilS/MesJ
MAQTCNTCVLPSYPPDITIDSSGLCSVCKAYKKEAPIKFVESDFVAQVKKAVRKAKGQYDCLVMCSGGKDSTSALHKAVKKYGLRPLAFTFDHGFEDPGALANVRRATEILDVDWLMLKSHFMRDFFAEIICSGLPVPICPICSLWYMQLTYETARVYQVPVIISGWTRGQMNSQPEQSSEESFREFGKMTEQTSKFIQAMRIKYPKYKDFPLTMEEVIKKYRKIQVISPHWFTQEDPEEYSALIRKELDWQPIKHSFPRGSVNCRLNFAASHLAMKAYGYTHYHIEMSRLIRQHELTRAEALEALQLDIREKPVATMVKEVLDLLGCGDNEL